jgi:hypothetical protein
MRTLGLAVLLVIACLVAGCGEHPCTLGVGEPQWCTTPPGGAQAPFCREVCGVCEDASADRWGSACEAHCRARVGIDELTCEQLDATVEAEYRACVETSDAPGCGGDPRHGQSS